MIPPSRRSFSSSSHSASIALPFASASFVAVYPLPNSTASLPQTQITFRGIPASQIGSVQVVGSSTGAHSGTIQADSDGQGGSFVPSSPFAPNGSCLVARPEVRPITRPTQW